MYVRVLPAEEAVCRERRRRTAPPRRCRPAEGAVCRERRRRTAPPPRCHLHALWLWYKLCLPQLCSPRAIKAGGKTSPPSTTTHPSQHTLRLSPASTPLGRFLSKRTRRRWSTYLQRVDPRRCLSTVTRHEANEVSDYLCREPVPRFRVVQQMKRPLVDRVTVTRARWKIGRGMPSA